MNNYDFSKIEDKWRKAWDATKIYATDLRSLSKQKFYNLMMFPYPSGDKLHIGHVYNYTGADAYGRVKMMEGKNLFEPMGYDAFGLPAENYAIKHGVHPAKSTAENIDFMREQLKELGCAFDSKKEINTSDPNYYKWTQWLFLVLYKAGLARRKLASVNWCPGCKTVLANEQVINGECERCGSKVIQKKIKQWFFEITKYADRLLADHGKLDWPKKTKLMQKNWIGKSEGVEIDFGIANSNKNTVIIIHGFTGNSSENWFPWLKKTLENKGYKVIVPDLPDPNKPDIDKWTEALLALIPEVEGDLTVIGHSLGAFAACKFVEAANKKIKKLILVAPTGKSESKWEGLKKVGFDDEDIKTLNNFNSTPINLRRVSALSNNKLIYLSKNDPYVPLSIQKDYQELGASVKIFDDKKHFNHAAGITTLPEIIEDIDGSIKVFTTRPDTLFGATYLVLAPENPIVEKIITDDKKAEVEKYIQSSKNKTERQRQAAEKEKTGVFIGAYAVNPANNKKIPIWIADYVLGSYGTGAIMAVPAHDERDFAFAKTNNLPVVEVISADGKKHDRLDKAYVNQGVMINSDEFSGRYSHEGAAAITKWLEKKRVGRSKTEYKLRDWLISRQRYWGAPIPIIFCEKDGEVPVPEKDLPVRLPDLDDFKPSEDGQSPLAKVPDFVNVKCPKCGGEAKRSTETMDTFVCSTWYYLRYLSPDLDAAAFDENLVKTWLPVDQYTGGAEHAVLHLLYSRFIAKVLFDQKLIPFDEPFPKLNHQGLILAEDGSKMSKSRGNVVIPDEYFKKYGVDVFRMFVLFLAPFELGGSWSDKGILGVTRFLDKVWAYKDTIDDKAATPDSLRFAHQTIKKVTADYQGFHFNTVVSSLMEYFNFLSEKKETAKETWQIFIKLMAPICPYLAEELWEILGNQKSIFQSRWPKYDEKLARASSLKIAVQINGKVRGVINIGADTDEKEVLTAAQNDDKIKSHFSGKKIEKSLYVPGRIVSFVIK